MRSYLFLAVGLCIGVTGAVLFQQSMPPKEGSPEKRIAQLEVELKRSTNRVAALEAADPNGRSRPGQSLQDGLRNIAQDIRDGRPVTPDDVFQATQPLIRDLSPLFDRMRIKELQRQSDTKSAELARKYSLTPSQQEALKQWFDQNAVDQAKAYSDLISQKGVKLEDIAKAATQVELNSGLDQFMESTLKGEKLAAYQSDRMLEKVERVQSEADLKVERLDGIVQLDESQRGQVFGIMARGSAYYDPAMQLEGLGTSTPMTGKSKQDAVLAVLRPDQRQAYQAAQEKRRAEEQKELEAIGLTLPDDWSGFETFD